MTDNVWSPEDYAHIQRTYQSTIGNELFQELTNVRASDIQNLIDLGCGDGSLTAQIADKCNGTVTAIDNSGAMISAARLNNPGRINFVECNVLEWIPPHGVLYDVAFSNAALHWLPNLEAYSRLLNLVRTYLRPGGHLAFRFSLRGHATELKMFLRGCLLDFVQSEGQVRRSPFDFQSVKDETARLFRPVVARELRFNMFGNPDDGYLWVIGTQPWRNYVPERDHETFRTFVRDRWRTMNPVGKGHQVLLIAVNSA